MKQLIFKRDERLNMDPNRILISSVESILDAEELKDDASRVQMLIDTVRQYIVFTGADTDRIRPGAPKGSAFDGPHSPDIIVADLVKRVADGEPTKLSRGFFEKLARQFGERDRREGETIEKARARFHQTPQGRLLNEAAKRAPVVEPATAQPAHGPALSALHKRAAEIAASDSLSRPRAIAKIAESRDARDRALWQAAKAEYAARAA